MAAKTSKRRNHAPRGDCEHGNGFHYHHYPSRNGFSNKDQGKIKKKKHCGSVLRDTALRIIKSAAVRRCPPAQIRLGRISILLFSIWAMSLAWPHLREVLFMYVRTSLPFIAKGHGPSGYFDPLPTSKTCVVQSFDRKEKKEYTDFIQRNKQWAEQMGFSYHEYIQEEHEERLKKGKHKITINDDGSRFAAWNILDRTVHSKRFPVEAPHYLKYHAIQHLFSEEEEHDCDYAIYIDSDAVVFQPSLPSKNRPELVPNVPWVDVMFGNEVFEAALSQIEGRPKTAPFNSGFLLMRKSDFTLQFIEDVLHHPRCNICRDRPCMIFGFYDQGCVEKLLQHEYLSHHNRFGVAKIQNTAMEGTGFLLCHLAGLDKSLRKDRCAIDTSTS